MVFQSYALFPHLSVLDNVAYGLVVSGLPRAQAHERAREALASVGLGGYDARLPAELSGGQQQRVAVARALVLQPSVMLFDEPLSNLDARLRRSMREEIRALQQRLGLTVAYVTHDQGEALAVSDLVIVMDAGRVAQAGSPRALYERPANRFVAGFMGEALLLPAQGLPGGDLQLGPLRLAAPGGAAPAGPLTLAVRPEAWQVGAPGQPGLPATVLRSAYLGAVLELSLATALGEVFVVAPSTLAVAPGTEVSLSLTGQGVAIVETGS
jgi:iron(III) transport system ATP-binding protein